VSSAAACGDTDLYSCCYWDSNHPVPIRVARRSSDLRTGHALIAIAGAVFLALVVGLRESNGRGVLADNSGEAGLKAGQAVRSAQSMTN